MINIKNDICYICGLEKATTKDHIPPKCIFPDSLKQQNIKRITVSACEKCNHEMGKIDEVIRDYLSLCIFTSHREEVWEKTRRKLTKSPRLRQEMIDKMIDLSKSKIPTKYIKENTNKAIILPKEFDKFIKRIFKGFHSHATGNIVGNDYDVNIWDYPEEIVQDNLKYVNFEYIVKDVLIMLGAITGDKTMSMWWFQMYNNPMYVCIIGPKAILS